MPDRQEDGASPDDMGAARLERRKRTGAMLPAVEEGAAERLDADHAEALALAAIGDVWRGATYVCDPHPVPTWWEREGFGLLMSLICGGVAALVMVLVARLTATPGWECAVLAVFAVFTVPAGTFLMRLRGRGRW